MAGSVDNTIQDAVFLRQGGAALVLRPAGRLVNEDLLWGDCPIVNYFLDPTVAVLYDEPFVGFDSTNDWTLTQATAGTGAVSTTIPGALTLNAGDTTTLHGPQIQRLTAAFVPAANKSIWFEVTVQVAFLTGDFFLGLAASDTSIIASSAMTTQNRIGWTSLTADGILTFDCDKAGTGSQPTGTTLVAATSVALGFFYDGVADTVQQYVNGAAVGSAIATTYIPKAVIYPSFVCQNHGTDRTTMTISALRVLQLR